MSMRMIFNMLKEAKNIAQETIFFDISAGAAMALSAKLQQPSISNKELIAISSGVSLLSFGIHLFCSLYTEKAEDAIVIEEAQRMTEDEVRCWVAEMGKIKY